MVETCATVIPCTTTATSASRDRLSPRLGLAIDLGPRRVLRLAWQDWIRPATTAILAPVATPRCANSRHSGLFAPGGRLRAR